MNLMSSIASFSIIVIAVLGVLSVIFFFMKGYKKVANDEILVVYGGSNKKGKASRTCSGGGIFVIPFLQSYSRMSLQPISVEIDLTEALTKSNVRINVPSQFTVAIDTRNEATMQNAIVRLLSMETSEIRDQVKDIVLGQFRAVISTMDIDEITQDRDTFKRNINDSVESELSKIGITIMNVNIKDITDEHGYINARGRKEMTSAVERSRIDVAEQERIGAEGVSENERQKEIIVATNNSQKDIGVASAERDTSVETARLSTEQKTKENEYQASLAESNAKLTVSEAESKRTGETARADSERAIYEEQQKAEEARKKKEVVPEANVAKERLRIESEAQADKARIDAEGEADAMLQVAKAGAESTKLRYVAEAEGFKQIVDAFGGDNQAALSAMMMEHLPRLAEIQADAIKNIDFSKVVLINQGGEGGNGKAPVGNFVNDLFSSVPMIGEMLSAQGYEMPSFLGQQKEVFDHEENTSEEKEKKESSEDS